MSSTPEGKEKSFVPQQGKKKHLTTWMERTRAETWGTKVGGRGLTGSEGERWRQRYIKRAEKSLVQVWDRGRGKVKQYLVSEEHKNWLISVFYSPSCQPAIHAVCISSFSWDAVKIVHLHAAFPAREPQPEELFSTAVKKTKRGKRIKKKKKGGHLSYSSSNSTLVAVLAKTTTVPPASAPGSHSCAHAADQITVLIWWGIWHGSSPWCGSSYVCQSAGGSTT